MPPPKLEIHASKTRTLGLLALACFMVGLSVFCAQQPRTDAVVFGWLGVCFFSLGILAMLRQLMQRGALFIIDKNGIEDRRSRLGLIEWADIKRFSITSMKSQKFLGIEVRAPGKYLDRLPKIGRAAAKANRALGFPEITLSFGGLTHTVDDVWTFLHEHHFANTTAPAKPKTPPAAE